ncbi:MAG: ferritin [Bacteroidota bacterium]
MSNQLQSKSVLHPDIESLLQAQIQKENKSSNVYLSMATWCDVNSYEGSASFLYKQAEEERAHMLKIMRYLIEKEAKVHVPGVEQINTGYPSLYKIFEKVLYKEKEITQSIHHIVTHSLQHQDYATFDFLQWFVHEQREEEYQANSIMGYFEVIPQDGVGLHIIDQKIGELTQKELPLA